MTLYLTHALLHVELVIIGAIVHIILSLHPLQRFSDELRVLQQLLHVLRVSCSMTYSGSNRLNQMRLAREGTLV